MLGWIKRGVSQPRVTTKYPRADEPASPGFVGGVELLADRPASSGPSAESLARLCPTGAISASADGTVALDHNRCVVCGDCVRAAPQLFAERHRYQTATRVPGTVPLAAQASALKRSLHVRHIDCGSDGSEEWEIQALWNPHYDIQRLGFQLTNSPRHADLLLVTGPVTAPMREPLQRTWALMGAPKALIAVGTDACGGGFYAEDRELDSGELNTGALTAGGVETVLKVDVYVPGSPPAPIAILEGMLLAAGLLAAGEAER